MPSKYLLICMIAHLSFPQRRGFLLYWHSFNMGLIKCQTAENKWKLREHGERDDKNYCKTMSFGQDKTVIFMKLQ